MARKKRAGLAAVVGEVTGSDGSAFRRTGQRGLNKAGGSNPRTGRAFDEVVRADGVKGHMYNADDPDSIVWLGSNKNLGSRSEGGRAGGAAAALEQQAQPANPSRSYLEELLRNLGAPRQSKNRFRQL
jgi:hypothetical protein